MKTYSLLATLLLSVGGMTLVPLTSPAAPAAASYQVTGPVISVDETKIVVQKGKEKWEINRTATLKVNGGTIDQIKPGDKVTIHYTMTADSVDLKAAPKTSGTAAAPKK